MANRSNANSALRATLGEFLAIKQEDLITRQQWGDITFEDSLEDIDAIYAVVHLLSGLPLERLPRRASEEVRNALNDALSWIVRIDKFSLREGSPTQQQEEIVTNLQSVQEQLYERTHQWIPFLAYMKGDIPAQLDSITKSVGLAKSTYDGFVTYEIERRAELDAAVAAAREASGRAGAAHFTKDFLGDAENREKDAETWLTRSVWSASITVAVAVGFFFWRAEPSAFEVVQFTTSKLVVLAMLIAITAWCAGNYRANKHQATVGRHKGHALQTFEAFVRATDNEDVKDAVLLETTRSIFAHTQSGYLKAEPLADSSPRVMEILRSSASARLAGE